jgi:hypothetical protein
MKHLKLAIVLAACVAASSLGGTAQASSDTPKVNSEVSDPATVRSGSSLTKIRKIISASAYAGAYLERETGHLKVMVTRSISTPTLDPTSDAPVDIVIVQHSLQDLERQMYEVFQARSALARKGVSILRVDANEITNTLDVAIEGPVTAQARDSIAGIVPGAPLVLSSEVRLPESNLSRIDDFAPWSAGAFINVAGVGTCTSGPGVRVGSTEYMLTAGHCGTATGQLVRQGHPDVPQVPMENVGTIANRSGYPNLDAMLVTANVSPTLYRSWYNLSLVSSTPWESLVNQTVCTGGAFTGESCNLHIVRVNFCGTTSCGLTSAGRNGSIAAGEGDSGGPVYILAPALQYSGIIKGSASDSIVCGNYPSGYRNCYEYITFTRIQNTLSYFGASLASL